MRLFRSLIRSVLLDTAYLLQWAIEYLTPEDPTPLGVLEPSGEAGRWGETPLAGEDLPDICEDCNGECGVCQTLNARYYAPPGSGFGGGGVYHARADRE